MRPLLLFLGLLFGGMAWGQSNTTVRPAAIPQVRRITAGKTPVSVAVADFNADGQLDVAALDASGNQLLIFLGKANSFAAHQTYPVGAKPAAIVTGDFNQDGNVDIAVASSGDGAVMVLLGDGKGGFTPGMPVPTCPSPEALVVSDFNGDGLADVAVLCRAAGMVQVLPGIGGGQFGQPVPVVQGADPAGIAAADFDGDGRSDLAVSDGRQGTVLIFPRGGLDGRDAIRLEAGGQPQALAAGDFDGDGFPDLAVAYRDGNEVKLFLSDRHGGFAPPKSHPTLARPAAMTAADFDGDGKLDLALSHPGSNEVSILLGAGDGTIKVSKRIPTGAAPIGISAGLPAPGPAVLAVANSGDASLSVIILPQDSFNEVTVDGGNYQTAMVNGSTFSGAAFSALLQISLSGYCIDSPCSIGHVRFQVQSDNNWGCVYYTMLKSQFCSTDHTYTTNGGAVSVVLYPGTKAGSFIVTVTNLDTGNFVTLFETNYNGPPASIATQSGTPQSAYVGTAFPNSLVAQVLDSFGNPYIVDAMDYPTYTTVIFTVPGSGPTASFGGVDYAFANTNAAGVATSPALAANTAPGSYSVTASDSNATPGVFSLTNVPFPIVTTSPGGLAILVDGVSRTAPQTITSWTISSAHPIAVASPQGVSGTRYVYSSWSDGGAQSHIVIAPSIATTYTANFTTQYQLTTSASSGCTVAPSTGTFYGAGTVVPISVTVSPGYLFSNWTGSVADHNNPSTSVTMSGPQSVTANCQAGTTIQTSPAGLQFSVDGGPPQIAPQSLNLSPGTHGIAVLTTQPGTAGSQFLFLAWSDLGAPSHNIVVGSSPAIYTASFKTQYQLTISASPVSGGTVTPGSGGFYDVGTAVPITATANPGYSFGSWSGGAANPGNASTTVTMNAPATITGNFLPLTAITIQTNPLGLQFSVDGGASQIAPQTLILTQTTHTIAVGTTQPGSAGTQYVYTGWSDTGAPSHTISVGSGAATYTASFKTQYQLTISASPVAGGAVTPSSGGFYDVGTVVPITATANSGYSFNSWSGGVVNPTGTSTSVTMNGPATIAANFSSLTGITIQTNPPGLQFSVDNTAPQTAPQTLNLTQGTHGIAVTTTQPGSAGTQYVFTGWSDSGAPSHNITVGSSAATFTASFKTQYRLTISASPAAGGTVTPASGGFYDAGSAVPITATANSGYSFGAWSGGAANPGSASTTVTMNGPMTITGGFLTLTAITFQTNPSGLQFSVDGTAPQTAPQTLSLSQGPHTIAVDLAQPGTPGTQFAFTQWSDNGAASHSITVGSAAATYTAGFKRQYQLTIAASPAAGGTVTPASGEFYDAGTAVPIAATPNSGYTFTTWSGGGVASPSSASTTVTMSGPATITGNFSSLTGITIQTNPPGLQFSVDGGATQTAPQTLNLSQTTHTIAVLTTQPGPAGAQYVFTGWSDAGASSHVITVSGTATYLASFKTQYQLTVSASPPAGGTFTPASGGFYDAGSAVPITATANIGYGFIGWSGVVAVPGSASTTVTMNGPEAITGTFSALSAITFQTNPPGLQFSVDGGAAQAAPQTLNLTQTTHTIAVVSTQPGPAGMQYVFTGWSDGGASSHIITVSGAATFTATFKTQYQLTISASPAAGGTITPATGGFYDLNAVVPIAATANTGYTFDGWSGVVALPGSASTTVTISGPAAITANFSLLTGITIQTNPAGLLFSVDGGAAQIAPQTLSLTQGAHTIAVASTQAGPAGTQYVFTGWSDSGALSHNINVAGAAAYTATFKTQYQLTISASPAAGGTLTPASGGFYDAGAVVPITAAVNSGYTFSGWSGGAASPGSVSTTVTMSGPMAVAAGFSTSSAPATVIQTNPSGLQFSVDGGALQTAPQTLNLTPGAHTLSVPSPQAGPAGGQYVFTGWSDGGAASHTITVSGDATFTASFSSAALPAVTFQTSPQGLQFSVDGGAAQTAPQTLNLTAGAHTVAVASTQPGPAGTQYVFTGWSDSGAASHTITVSASTNLTASFKTQYQLTISASPVAGGAVTPASGTFYDSHSVVPIAATAHSGYLFSNWTGATADPNNPSTTVTMLAPETVTAVFASNAIPFFAGSTDVGSGIQFLTFPNGTPFGYYVFVAAGWIYHADLGYMYGTSDASGAGAYFWDLTTGHWLYTNRQTFPYLYDFTLNTFLYYFPDDKNAGHYLTAPRVFADMATGRIFTM